LGAVERSGAEKDAFVVQAARTATLASGALPEIAGRKMNRFKLDCRPMQKDFVREEREIRH
jgi:hypothetical protein